MAALAQLAGSLFRALSRMSRAPVVDDKVLGDCLNNVSRALLLADVRFETVRAVQASIRSAVSHRSLAAAGTDRRRIIKLTVEAELHRILDPGPSPSCLAPTRGKKPTSVVMLVGLQGSGKTTTCVKYADYHRRKGFSPALVCADTFRGADALDQLRHTAAKAGIPLEFVYGSYTESDPVKVAVDGVDRFRNAADLIVVDTSGLHGQEEETRQVAEATRPDLVVLVVDATIGQAAFHQALALKQSAGLVVGAVIVTKMDGNAKVVGALSAVAATKISPVIFIGTGEHVADLEAFDASSVARRLLSMGDLASCTCRRHARNSCRSMLMPPLASCSVA